MSANSIVVVVASALLLMVGPQDVLAQDAEPRLVQPGDLVRVHFNQRRRNQMRGELVALGSDSLTLLRGDEVRHLALEEIRKIQIGEGRHRGVSATFGIFGGALIGAFVLYWIERGLSGNCRDYCGLTGVLIGLPVGAVGGGIAGATVLSAQRWHDASFPAAGEGAGGSAGAGAARPSADILTFRVAL